MKNLAVCIIALTYLIVSTGVMCEKVTEFGKTDYYFNAEAKIINAKEQIKIGDTIWFELIAPILQFDINTGKHIKFDLAKNFSVPLSFVLLSETNKTLINSAIDFKFIVRSGKLEESNILVEKVRTFSHIVKNDNYYIEIGIIPSKEGKYFIGVSDITKVFNSHDNLSASYNVKFIDTEQHFDLYNNSIYNTALLESKRQIYFFNVN